MVLYSIILSEPVGTCTMLNSYMYLSALDNVIPSQLCQIEVCYVMVTVYSSLSVSTEPHVCLTHTHTTGKVWQSKPICT